MIYIDSSVALAYLFTETRAPSDSFFGNPLASSRLLEYEVWNRVHVTGSPMTVLDDTRRLLAGIQLIELDLSVLGRALQRWPVPIRTLDSLHLATIDFLRRRGREVELASYDNRMLAAAQAMGVPIASL